MKNISTISIGYHTYMLPESMTAREIQTLAGLVATLRKVDYVLSNRSGDYQTFHYLGEYCEVKLGTSQASTSREQAESARDAYDQEQADKADAEAAEQ